MKCKRLVRKFQAKDTSHGRGVFGGGERLFFWGGGEDREDITCLKSQGN